MVACGCNFGCRFHGIGILMALRAGAALSVRSARRPSEWKCALLCFVFVSRFLCTFNMSCSYIVYTFLNLVGFSGYD